MPLPLHGPGRRHIHIKLLKIRPLHRFIDHRTVMTESNPVAGPMKAKLSRRGSKKGGNAVRKVLTLARPHRGARLAAPRT